MDFHQSSSPTIRETLQNCIRQYALVLPQLKDVSAVATLQSHLDRLKLWAGNIGVFAPGKAAVDYRLRNDPDTRSVIVGLLNRLTQKASSYGLRVRKSPASSVHSDIVKEPYAVTDDNDGSELRSETEEAIASGSDSLDESEVSIEGTDSVSKTSWMNGVEQVIKTLFLLASVIRKPIKYQDNTRIVRTAETSGLQAELLNDLADHVRFQLRGKHQLRQEPNSEGISDAILNRMVDAAIFRLQRFNYKKKHARKLQQGTNIAFKPVLLPEQFERLQSEQRIIPIDTGAPRFEPVDESSRAKSVPGTAMLSGTVASSYHPQKLDIAPKPAPSLISQSAVLRHGRLDFPPVPKLISGNDMLCPYCLLPLDTSSITTKSWRAHVLNDLEPYICVFEQCKEGNKLYSKIDDALQHMRWNHSMVWSCNALGHESAVFTDPAAFIDHLTMMHSASLSEAQIPMVLEKSMKPSQEAFETCPICLDSVHGTASDIEVMTTAIGRLDPVRWFRNHVAKHMEFIALLALPPRSDIDEEDDSRVKQHQSAVSLSAESDLEMLQPDDGTLFADNISKRLEDPDIPDVSEPTLLFSEPWSKGVEISQESDPNLQTFLERAREEAKPTSQAEPIPVLQDCYIAIFCTVSSVLTALAAMLDEEYEMPASHNLGENMGSFYLGRMYVHKVLIVYTGLVNHGKIDQATIVSVLSSMLPECRIVLSVGLGGSLPGPSDGIDIRLGDVVVGQPTDFSKAVLELTGNQHSQDLGVVNGFSLDWHHLNRTLGRLQRTPEETGARMSTVIGHKVSPELRLAGYFYPGLNKDVLYEAVSGESSQNTSDNVADVEVGRIVHRHSRETLHPQVHYGSVLSIHEDLFDGKERSQLFRKTKALAVENQLGSFDHSFPCLVVRGIHNYGLEHKTHPWERYAAITAASYVYEVLGWLSKSSVLAEASILNYIASKHANSAEDTITLPSDPNQEADYKLKDSDVARLKELYESDYGLHKDFNPLRHPNTCLWVLRHASYSNWYKCYHNNVLCINAPGGYGKSVLCRSLVDEQILATPVGSEFTRHVVCYFFFSTTGFRASISSALRAFLHQTLKLCPWLIEALFLEESTDTRTIQGNRESLLRTLQKASSHAAKTQILCVLDGLDECPYDDRVWFLNQMCEWNRSQRDNTHPPGCLKFLFTMRPISGLDTHQLTRDQLPTINISSATPNSQYQKEINFLISFHLDKLYKNLRLSTSTRDTMELSLLRVGERPHLWLSTILNNIVLALDSGIISQRALLARILPNLSAAYESLLANSVTATNDAIVKLIFVIVIGAKKALSIDELRIVLDIAVPKQAPKAMRDLKPSVDDLRALLQRECVWFFRIRHDHVYLSHALLKEFLVKNVNVTTAPDAKWQHCFSKFGIQRTMAIVCVRYLCLEELSALSPMRFPGSGPMANDFYYFAALHWAQYVRAAESALMSHESRKQLDQLYDTSQLYHVNWTNAAASEHQTTTRQRNALFDLIYPSLTGCNQIQLASFNGHPLYLKHILTISKSGLDHQNMETGYTAMMLAIFQGYDDIVKILLDNGADPNITSGICGSALWLACSQDQLKATELLLNRGNAEAIAPEGCEPALIEASAEGSEAIVEMLLGAGYHPDEPHGQFYGTALQAASWGAHKEVILKLLEAGAMINLASAGHGTALCAACVAGHVDTVRLLLQHGADIHQMTSGVSTSSGDALQTAATFGHTGVVRELLERGANVDTQGGFYGTALRAAAARGYHEVVDLLLANLADIGLTPISESGEKLDTALQAAAKNGRDRVVQSICDRANGSEISMEQILDSVEYAARKAYAKIVQRLLEYCDFQCYQRSTVIRAARMAQVTETALSSATKAGSKDTVSIVLASKHVTLYHIDGALHIAAAAGFLDIVALLLDHDANVNARRGGNGETPLHTAAAGGHLEVVQLLFSVGADLQARGRDGTTAFLAACDAGHVGVAKYLEEVGALRDLQSAALERAIEAARRVGFDQIMNTRTESTDLDESSYV